MPGPSYTGLTALAQAIAAECSPTQAAITFVGENEQASRKGPPRVVWLPRSSKIEPAEQDESEDEKDCCQRVLTCEVAFLATDLDACWLLVDEFIAAVFRSQTRRSVRCSDEDYSQSGVAGSSRCEIKLTVTADFPIAFETYVSSEVEAASHTGTINEAA